MCRAASASSAASPQEELRAAEGEAQRLRPAAEERMAARLETERLAAEVARQAELLRCAAEEGARQRERAQVHNKVLSSSSNIYLI